MLNTTIISQEPDAITVRMSLRKWNHLRKLEESYKVAASIRKGMKQAEKAPAMSVDEAIESLRALGESAYPTSSRQPTSDGRRNTNRWRLTLRMSAIVICVIYGSGGIKSVTHNAVETINVSFVMHSSK